MPKKYYLKSTAQEIDNTVTAMKNMLETLTISPSGQSEIRAVGTYAYNLSYGITGGKTVNVKNIKVTLTSQNATVTEVTSSGFKVIASAIPMVAEQLTIRIEVTEKNSGTTVMNYQVRLVPVPCTAITVDGAATLGFGDYEYQVTEVPENATIHVASLDVSIAEINN